MKVTILAGISGSGKSTYARHQARHGALVVSADDFFMKNGRYEFDGALVGDAHARCLRMFIAGVQDQHKNIIVDNTNTAIDVVAPYVLIAKAFGYRVSLRVFSCSPETAARRNTHGVPLETLRKMYRNINQMLVTIPEHWGITVIQVFTD